jgi:hypothetical protein
MEETATINVAVESFATSWAETNVRRQCPLHPDDGLLLVLDGEPTQVAFAQEIGLKRIAQKQRVARFGFPASG